MTLVSRIRVQHIRTHHDFSLPVASSTTVVIGANGAGKTSLVEAVYIALQGTSFKGTDKDVLRRGSPWYRIDVVFNDDRMRTVKFDAEKTGARKQFIVDGKNHYRLGVAQRYPVVLFEPDDLRLLGGSPVRRRQFIDRLISQINPHYAVAIRRYERALKQRNALLKQPSVSDNTLFAWDVALSEYGSYVIKERLHFIAKIDDDLNNIYTTISGINDKVSVSYSHSHADTQQKLLADLHTHTNKDKMLGYTSVGPHRHDLLFDFNGSAMVDVASRGEIRSVVLALKFIEVHLTERMTGTKPLILLDDVFSELDETRQKNLVTEFTDHQIIITSASVVSVKGSSIIRLEARDASH